MSKMFSDLNKKKITYGIIILFIMSALLIHLMNVPIFSLNIHGELSESFKTVDELKQKADIIVEADVVKANSIKYNNVVFTLSDVVIKKTYKGHLQNNEYIKILETGGVYNNIEHTFEGQKTLKRQEKAILFLKKYVGPVTKDQAYTVLGVYQGKFNLDSSGNIVSKNLEYTTQLDLITNKNELNLE
ncbi:hypothetical protein QJ48_09760 [Paenibacillus sp. A3]|uniref:hypothetical protein n=1 Tax=Paenibacillus sp. A3 TaxID=1337054 RepID=UPI0006D56B37|nr:hypothetical protein [Paenibacillus sp. A3]KPV59667.1 hypothetical protein QJ48_09760 [Paenibacillus sp. A3]